MSQKINKAGFTVMELMIAISVLAIILLISSTVLVGIGNLYSKGNNLANVQDTTRNIVESVVSAVQFSGTLLNNGASTNPITYTYATTYGNVPVSAYCFGQNRYSFVTNPNLPDGWPHILWLDKISSTGSCEPLNLSQPNPTCTDGTYNCTQPGSGSDLIGPNMHLATFDITQYNPKLYGINVGVAFGAIDMFVSNNNGPVLINGNYQCSNSAGQQYCATSYLGTFAAERLTQQ